MPALQTLLSVVKLGITKYEHLGPAHFGKLTNMRYLLASEILMTLTCKQLITIAADSRIGFYLFGFAVFFCAMLRSIINLLFVNRIPY